MECVTIFDGAVEATCLAQILARDGPDLHWAVVGQLGPAVVTVVLVLEVVRGRRRARRDPDNPLVFHRNGIPIRRWRTGWRTACQATGVPTRFLHDCRCTAARTLIRASVPERVAMLLTGHKSRAIFGRYNIIHEQELLDAARERECKSFTIGDLLSVV